MLKTLVQDHSLRSLNLGANKFEVDTIPEIVGTMTNLEKLSLSNLGYTGNVQIVLAAIRFTCLFCREDARFLDEREFSLSSVLC